MTTKAANDREAPEVSARHSLRKASSKSLTRSTGPRTLRGKRKSRYNALKHGIFAHVVLHGTALKESKEDYLDLVESFRESFQPVGGVEEMLVEKLAMLAWRKARAVRAEAAIIMKQTEFFREDREALLKRASEGGQIDIAILGGGIARRFNNPYLLNKAIRLLETLEGAIEDRGFDPNIDERVLRALYGEQGYRDGLYLSYRIFSDPERKPSDDAQAKRDQQVFLKSLKMEIEKLQSDMIDLEEREEKELPLKEESLAIPGEKDLDRLMRYETRLDGSFDRTLQQLERLQRVRKGQPLPPTLKVDVSRG